MKSVKGKIRNPKTLVVSDPWYLDRGEVDCNYVKELPDGEYFVHIRTMPETLSYEEYDIECDIISCEICIANTKAVSLTETFGEARYNSKVMCCKEFTIGVDTAHLFVGTTAVADIADITAEIGSISTGGDGYIGNLFEITALMNCQLIRLFDESKETEIIPVTKGFAGVIVNLEFSADIVDEDDLLSTLISALNIKEVERN